MVILSLENMIGTILIEVKETLEIEDSMMTIIKVLGEIDHLIKKETLKIEALNIKSLTGKTHLETLKIDLIIIENLENPEDLEMTNHSISTIKTETLREEAINLTNMINTIITMTMRVLEV